MIVIRNADKGLWAIAVDEPPDLIDIPSHALSPVPAETRFPGALQWVSHVATCEFSHSKLNESHACLVLDLSALLLARQADISSHQPEFLEIEPPLDLDNISIDNIGEVNENIREKVHLQLPVLNLSEKH